MRKALIALPVAALLLLGLLLTTKPCACENPDDLLRMTFRGNPQGEVEAFRQAALQTFPPGTSWSVLNESIAGTRSDKCEREARGVVCTWAFAKSDFGLFHDGFRMEFKLDQQQNLVDIRAGAFRKWF